MTSINLRYRNHLYDYLQIKFHSNYFKNDHFLLKKVLGHSLDLREMYIVLSYLN